jgi:hypothetical protein
VPTVEVLELSQPLGMLIPEQSSFQEGNHDESTFTLPACGLMHKARASKKNDIARLEVYAEFEKRKLEATLLEASYGYDNLIHCMVPVSRLIMSQSKRYSHPIHYGDSCDPCVSHHPG